MARFYYRPGHPKASTNGFVAAEDLMDEATPLAVNAPILAGRFYENTKATDGTDIGSRRKHQEYMKAHNLTIASDFTKTWEQQAKERRQMSEGGTPQERRERREAIDRAFHQRFKS